MRDFDQRLTYIPIHPKSFHKEQRVEASALATELGQGLLMEVGSGSTRFYASPDVAVGFVEVYAPKEYKGVPEYVTTLESPEQDWNPSR